MERGKKMKKILIKESDLIKLIETAMDLDIYSQPSQIDTNNGNLDAEETVEDIISKLKELLYMLKSGKKINTNSKSEIFKTFDNINKTFSNIKYNSQS
jgi:tRNA pseudouridine-54 N-methylase